MDKSWMKKRRGCKEYVEGVLSFVKFASLHAHSGKILCPCTKCVNLNLVPPGVAQAHLWSHGMLGSYTHWKFHGESATAPECGSSHVQDSHGRQRVEAQDEEAHGRQRVEAQDEDAHISQEARPVASDDDETQALDDYQQSPAAENRHKRRGPTKLADIWALDGSWKIPLPLNDQGQPIGLDGKTFVRWLGTFCYNGVLCPLVPAGWPTVPDKFKQDCWSEIEKRYLIDPDIVKPPDQMGWAMHILGVLRRNRRTKLKKEHIKVGVTKEQLLAKTPPGVMENQWPEMVNYWFDEKTVTLSNKNKVSRGKQKEIATSGAQSFAQISEDMAKANRAPVERANMYLKVYRRRDGTGVTPHAQENINRMEELLRQPGMRLQGEPGSGVLWSKDDAYAQVFGPERPGRVRGVGLGITPSGRSATNASQFTSTPSLPSRTTQRISELENHSSRVTEQLAQVLEQLAQSGARHQEQLSQMEARHQEQLSQMEARHQQQMAEVMTRMNAMFAQISQGVHSLDMSQCLRMGAKKKRKKT